MSAYIEVNAAKVGSEALTHAWNAMLAEIQQKLAAIPKAIRDAAIAAASGTIETVTGVPAWAWIAGGVVVTGLVGFAAWKIINSRAGAAVTGAVARRYLP